jgi:hypothetical protein
MGAAVSIKIPPALHFLSLFGLSLLALVGAFALSWFGKNSGTSFLMASSFFAVVASTSAARSKSATSQLLAIIKQMKE